MRYSSNLPNCDVSDMYLTASARGGWHALGARLGLYFLWCNRPYSAGSVSLKSRNSDIYPSIDLNLLSDRRDLDRMKTAVKLLAQLVIHPALNESARDFFPASFSPRIKRLSRFTATNRLIAAVLGFALDGPASFRQFMIEKLLLGGGAFQETLQNDGALEDFIRQSIFGVWHPSGTCRMGDPSDPLAVVDSGGKVIGAENVYVADASVMPRLPTANTNIPTIMIAEKISDALLKS